MGGGTGGGGVLAHGGLVGGGSVGGGEACAGLGEACDRPPRASEGCSGGVNGESDGIPEIPGMLRHGCGRSRQEFGPDGGRVVVGDAG